MNNETELPLKKQQLKKFNFFGGDHQDAVVNVYRFLSSQDLFFIACKANKLNRTVAMLILASRCDQKSQIYRRILLDKGFVSWQHMKPHRLHFLSLKSESKDNGKVELRDQLLFLGMFNKFEKIPNLPNLRQYDFEDTLLFLNFSEIFAVLMTHHMSMESVYLVIEKISLFFENPQLCDLTRHTLMPILVELAKVYPKQLEDLVCKIAMKGIVAHPIHMKKFMDESYFLKNILNVFSVVHVEALPRIKNIFFQKLCDKNPSVRYATFNSAERFYPFLDSRELEFMFNFLLLSLYNEHKFVPPVFEDIQKLDWCNLIKNAESYKNDTLADNELYQLLKLYPYLQNSPEKSQRMMSEILDILEGDQIYEKTMIELLHTDWIDGNKKYSICKEMMLIASDDPETEFDFSISQALSILAVGFKALTPYRKEIFDAVFNRDYLWSENLEKKYEFLSLIYDDCSDEIQNVILEKMSMDLELPLNQSVWQAILKCLSQIYLVSSHEEQKRIELIVNSFLDQTEKNPDMNCLFWLAQFIPHVDKIFQQKIQEKIIQFVVCNNLFPAKSPHFTPFFQANVLHIFSHLQDDSYRALLFKIILDELYKKYHVTQFFADFRCMIDHIDESQCLELGAWVEHVLSKSEAKYEKKELETMRNLILIKKWSDESFKAIKMFLETMVVNQVEDESTVTLSLK